MHHITVLPYFERTNLINITRLKVESPTGTSTEIMFITSDNKKVKLVLRMQHILWQFDYEFIRYLISNCNFTVFLVTDVSCFLCVA